MPLLFARQDSHDPGVFDTKTKLMHAHDDEDPYYSVAECRALIFVTVPPKSAPRKLILTIHNKSSLRIYIVCINS
jgi:hypothetical protein